MDYFEIKQLYRPSKHVEKSVRKRVEKLLFKKYAPGIYSDYKTINDIMKFLMNFYDNMLNENLNEIVSIEFMKFILNQYDITHGIQRSIMSGNESVLYKDEVIRWQYLGPVLRRALKFIAEKITIIGPQEDIKAINKHKLDEHISKVFIAAEEMAQLYMQSDCTYRVFNKETTLILNKGNSIYWDLQVDNAYIKNNFPPKIDYKEILGDRTQIDLDINFISCELKEGFEEKFGKCFSDIRDIIMDIIINQNNDIPFIEKSEVIKLIEKNHDIDTDNANNIISGFIITQKDLIEQNRQIYSPKQEYRALARGFFEFNYKGKEHLAWSPSMAVENLELLKRGICYKKIPSEWKSKKINTSIEHITNKVGAWFEKEVDTQLKKLSINGDINFKERIGSKDKFIIIPSNIGEIDYLGIDLRRKELIVAECKMISPALEPRLFYDDISKFRDEKKGYINQFNNKVAWISSNKQEILENLLNYLKLELPFEEVKEFKQKNILFTFYPSIIEAFETEFQISTLYKFMKDNEKIVDTN